MVSDGAMADRTAQVFAHAFGSNFTLSPEYAEPVSASEDYSEFVAAGVTSLFFGIGVSDPSVLAAAASGALPYQ